MPWKKKSKPFLVTIVTEDEAKNTPYPYVFVEVDGTVRELHISERNHLETPFHPTDGSRPYVKNSFRQRNALGSMKGYCLRSRIPPHLTIIDPPEKDPTLLTEEEIINLEIESSREQGFELVDKEHGKLIFRRRK